ncbi:MAG: DUF4159 domain-containing protein [Pseudomonadota bacterium]
MFGLPLAFTSPWLLLALVSLPAIWWLLRLTPPRPQEEVFPPTRILARLQEKEETPAQSPWWLTLLRLLMAAFIIIAMAGPILNPDESTLSGDGPVMIVMDDGWASATEWDNRRSTALSIVNEARESGRTVILESTTGRESWTGQPISAEDAAGLLQAAESRPLEPDHEETGKRIAGTINNTNPGQVSWLSDGLTREGTNSLVNTLNNAVPNKSIYRGDTDNLMAIEAIRNEPSSLIGTVIRADDSAGRDVSIIARDNKGLVLARTNASFGFGSKRAEFSFDQPVELRNQIIRLEIDASKNAAAVQLLDENNRRRLVGLISGEKYDLSQPLLSPLYYISKALEPFSDLRRADDANAAVAIPELIEQGVSAIALADVGVLLEESEEKLDEWVRKGGLLVRFAGPRLAASPTGDLLPVDIRPGDRSLGGALSWETPKPLAPFERSSPFFGIEAARDVLVKKQLLALQEAKLEEKTWATLEDGTPLVTAEQRDAGWIVLFHVGSDAEWSNLPLSGTFVEMLRRTVNLSRSQTTAGSDTTEITLPPLRVLDGEGQFTPPDVSVKPLVISAENQPEISSENPPGFYGTEDGFAALNLIESESELLPLESDTIASDFEQQSYLTGSRFEFKIWLLLAAAILLLLDCLAVLWMSGSLRVKNALTNSTASVAGALFATLVLISISDKALAQENEEIDFSAALETRLAYVITGVDEVDRISEAGMRGLTQFIGSRTALEPGDPIGLDVEVDELSFYSFIYWPIDPRAEPPSPQTMARVDRFMKEGGSILFDTRDQISGILGGTSSSPAAQALQRMLSTLDIPPLEPVPSDHVLTKSFYLLDTFPGRYSGGDLWVEATQSNDPTEGRPARAGDGVSSILITSNDMAGAWAVDNTLRPMLPTVPPDPAQRNYAFRSGVNLMMYALTGNYKADQVHLPALLERLGQ